MFCSRARSVRKYSNYFVEYSSHFVENFETFSWKWRIFSWEKKYDGYPPSPNGKLRNVLLAFRAHKSRSERTRAEKNSKHVGIEVFEKGVGG
jgi:hypothetical protein